MEMTLSDLENPSQQPENDATRAPAYLPGPPPVAGR
jgi:hypothetical protein